MNLMAFSTQLALFWSFIAFLTLLNIGKGETWLLSRRSRRSPSPKHAPTVSNCGPSVWSAWSECTPFCGLNVQRKRTRTVKKGGKCFTETSVQTGDCPARGGCDFCDANLKKCYCPHLGYTLRGKKCVDIDECQSNEGRGPCSHSCENTLGTYTCNCNKGYKLVGRTECTLLDCKAPQFSNCPQPQQTTDAEGNLPVCANITSSCQNGTTYNLQCTLSCPKYYKLALKKPTTKWSDFSAFEFRFASSSIICHDTAHGNPIWHSRLKDYYCRRSNDPPLAIQLVGTSIKEGLSPGSKVGRLSTSDSQKNQIMVFSVQYYQGKSLFRCNGSILESSLVFKWHPQGTNSYPVRIRAQDNGSPPMWAERVFNISVENVNDPPQSIEISKNWVYENASVGTVVGELSAIDDDLGNQRSSNFSWKLLEDISGNFKITDNKIVVNRSLNYHTRKLCYIKVTCSDLLSFTEKEIPIYVVNLIDPPTLNLTGNKIPENSRPGTVITQITSKSESNDYLKFMISETNPNATLKFDLSPDPVCEHHQNATKFITTCYVNITVSGQLDYETTSEYTFQVYVRNNVSSNFKKWNVSVENVNEKPDKLELNGMSKIPEDTKSGIDICFFLVSDPDNRNEMTQNHSCHVENSESDGEYFQVNHASNSLQVKKNKSLNYETQQSYLVTIRCVDSGVPPLSITRNFIINVTDTDEPIENLTLSNNQVKENAALGAKVGILDAFDPDIHRPKTMKFSLVGPTDLPFTLQGVNNEILAVNGSINFEKNSDYILTIRVTDTKGRYLQMPFVIKVIDVEERPTDIKLSKQHMDENLAPGSFISNITMIDEDENTMSICRLPVDGGGRIALNETTLVAGEKVTDYEKELSHVVNITLKCCDQTERCISKEFSIEVKDVNEPPTDILIDNLEVKENVKDIAIGKITILDPDTSSDYHCTLTRNNQTHNSFFQIINSNKTLYLVKELNFEKQQMITFEILCKDKENGNYSIYFSKQFGLKVVDVNESPSAGCENPLYVSQTQSIGTVIGNLNVIDPDNVDSKDICQPKQKLTYTMISGEYLPFEVLDGYLVKSGEVKTNLMSYNISISVQDDGFILARNFNRIQVKRKTTLFNCTVDSSHLIGTQITLSSNQIKAGSTNASVIGYLNMANPQNKTYQLMKDSCNNYPFIIEGNKLMLHLSAYSGPRSDQEYKFPQYAVIKVKASDTLTGDLTYTRFAIFINDDTKMRSHVCFTSDPVRLSQMANTPLGPIIIYQSHDNNTKFKCPPENNRTHQLHYRCNVKLNMNKSSKGFVKVNFTNALSVDKKMFLRINISISEEISDLDELVLDLFCWEPHRLSLFVKGRIVIPIAHEGACQNDRQPRDNNLCKDANVCSENSLCSKLENVGERCVPTDDQLFVILPPIQYGKSFCEFEDCLQEMLRDRKSDCLSTWNKQRRPRRSADNSLYLDTLNITFLRKKNKLLLRAAVWNVHGGELTLLSKKHLAEFPDSNDVIFITTKEECDWLIDDDIKCPVKDSGSTPEKRSSTPLGSPKIQAAVGAGSAILVIVIIFIVWNCLKRRKRNKEVKHKAQVSDFANRAFDDTELKELPPIPEQEQQLEDYSLAKKKKEKTGNIKYNFKNPVYEEPSETQAVEDNERHIYNETIPHNATYAQPEDIQKKSVDKAKETKAISNPFYEATDVIPVQKPSESGNGINCDNFSSLATQTSSTAAKEPEYETLPKLKDTKGIFSLSKNISKSKNPSRNQEFDDNIKNNDTNMIQVDKEFQDCDEKKQGSVASIKEPHYEELPLPEASIVNTWNLSQLTNKDNTQVLNGHTNISDHKESKTQAGKEPEYEELPALKDEKKRKGFLRLSKAFQDFMDSKQEAKANRKNSTNSEINRLSISNEMLEQSMLNPRDKAKKDNPAYKYPFYEELPPVNRTESFFEQTASQCDQQNAVRDQRSAPYYHILEGGVDARCNGEVGSQHEENDEKSQGHHYFILEKCSSTGNENRQYQSLHRELDPPSPAYESYRLPQKSGSELGSQICEALAAEGIDGIDKK